MSYVPTPKPVSGLLPDLSDKEKTVIGLGVLGMMGWFFFTSRKRK
jgi:hypothetical protein